MKEVLNDSLINQAGVFLIYGILICSIIVFFICLTWLILFLANILRKKIIMLVNVGEYIVYRSYFNLWFKQNKGRSLESLKSEYDARK